MTIPRTSRRRLTPKPSEDGYILVAVMFMLALLVIAMAVAAPKIARSIQRDREVETMHRGKQYRRAVKLYYKQFNAYPPNVDALVKTNEIRFLRKKYLDPMTGKADWKPIALGQNKAPTTMGFFGQPIGGTGAGGGLCGNALPSSTGATSSSGSAFGSSSSFGGNSSFGSSSSSFGSNSSFGSSSSSPTAGCPPASADTSSTSGSPGSNGAANGATGSDPNAPGGTDPNAGNGGATAGGISTGTGGVGGISNGTNTTGTNGQNGQSFGGAGIMGFEPASPKASILVYKKKTHYNEWEFVYDPIAEQMLLQGGAGGGSTGLGGAGTGTTGNGTGIGNNGAGFGNNGSAFGNNGSAFGANGSSFGTGANSGGTNTTTPPQQ